MIEFLAITFTGFLSFMSLHYILALCQVREPIRSIVAVLYAVILVVIAGCLQLADVID